MSRAKSPPVPVGSPNSNQQKSGNKNRKLHKKKSGMEGGCVGQTRLIITLVMIVYRIGTW